MCRGAKRAQTVFRTSQRVQELETERVFFKSILYLIFSLAGSLGQCVPYNTILVLYYDSFILGQMQLSCKRPSTFEKYSVEYSTIEGQLTRDFFAANVAK